MAQRDAGESLIAPGGRLAQLSEHVQADVAMLLQPVPEVEGDSDARAPQLGEGNVCRTFVHRHERRIRQLGRAHGEGHVFAESYEEHQENVARYRQIQDEAEAARQALEDAEAAKTDDPAAP